MSRKSGFTLIELIIVGAVIAILIVIALPRFRGTQIAGNIAKAKSELSVLQTAVENYYLHNNNVYPAVLNYLLNSRPQAVSYIPQDPFGRANKWGNIPIYGYDRGGTNDQFYVIYSVGPDGIGSAWIFEPDDIVIESNGYSCIYVSNARPRDTRP